jgi:hypothetical protein
LPETVRLAVDEYRRENAENDGIWEVLLETDLYYRVKSRVRPSGYWESEKGNYTVFDSAFILDEELFKP